MSCAKTQIDEMHLLFLHSRGSRPFLSKGTTCEVLATFHNVIGKCLEGDKQCRLIAVYFCWYAVGACRFFDSEVRNGLSDLHLSKKVELTVRGNDVAAPSCTFSVTISLGFWRGWPSKLISKTGGQHSVFGVRWPSHQGGLREVKHMPN